MTSVEFIHEKLFCDEYWYEKLTFEQIIEQAKEMHKQEIMNTYIIADSESTQEDSEHYALKFYERTYVSKGSDTLKDYHIVDANEMVDQVPDVKKMVDDEIKELKITLEKVDYYRMGYNRAKETLYTEEQVLEFAKWLASNWIPLHVTKEYLWEYDELDLSKIPQDYRGYKTEKQLFDIFQSLKQPKKD